MRNKYKNLQNRGQSLKGGSFVIPERRSQISSDNNINFINKNSFVANLENKDKKNKKIYISNDKEKKRISLNKGNINEKKLDSNILQNISNNTIKTSNHNILISVYRKESLNKETKTNTNANTNTNMSNNTHTNKNTNNSINRKSMKTRNENNLIDMNNTINRNIGNQNITITKNNHRNTKRIFSNKNQNNLNEMNSAQNSNKKNKLFTKDFRDQKKNEVKEIKYNKSNNYYNIDIKSNINDKENDNENTEEKNRRSVFNFRRKKNSSSYKNINNNNEEKVREITIAKKYYKEKEKEILKPDINSQKPQKFFNQFMHNYNSTNNISMNKGRENINNITNNYNSTTERNNQEKKKLLNFRKILRKENNLNDDKSVGSPKNTFILSPSNNNYSSRVKRKMTYRSKRASKQNIPEQSEAPETNNNENTNNDINNDNDNENDNNRNTSNIFRSKKRKYIKVTKTPNESNINKSIDNDTKTEDLNQHKKKIRHFLYYKSKGEKEKNDNDNKNEKEKEKKGEKIDEIKVEKKEDKKDEKKEEKKEDKKEDKNDEKKDENKDIKKEEKKDIKKEEFNIFSPIIAKDETQSEMSNSPKITFKKINNRIYKISPKQSFKDLLHEANQNKNLHDSFSNIFQSCKNDINTKNYETNTIRSQDLNKSFSWFPNELELNLDSKNIFLNYINNSSNKNDDSNDSRNITSSNINKYKNYSLHRNKNNNIKVHSPSNIIYKKKMNLIKSISNYYKKNNGILTSRILFNSNSNINIFRNTNTESNKNSNSNNMDRISVNKEKTSIEYSSNISNNIINNNTYNTTLNIFKVNDNDLKESKNSVNNIVVTKLKKGKKKEHLQIREHDENNIDGSNMRNKKHMRTNSEFQEIKSSSLLSPFNENTHNTNISSNSNITSISISKNNVDKNNVNYHKKNKSNTFSDLSEIINTQKINENIDFNNSSNDINHSNYKINLEILYILEIKFRNILNKINIYTVCPSECFDLITYYFSSKFYEKEINIFQTKHNINNISYYIKLELLCYFLCYDVCFNKSFSQTGILLKTIFNLLYNNYLILLSSILNTNTSNDINSNEYEYLPKLKTILKKNLKINISLQEYTESNILTLLGNNLKEVNTYYKMIIDNLYSHFYTKSNTKKNYNDTKYKFPHCLQLDINDLDYYEKLNIISLFFFDAYRLLNNYNFEDLKYFFLA